MSQEEELAKEDLFPRMLNKFWPKLEELLKSID